MRGILIFITHFAPLKFPGSHRAISKHGLLYKIGGHSAELDLMADLFSRIFEVEFDLSAHIASLSRLQILTVIIVLSADDVLDELKGLLALLLICVSVEFGQLIHYLSLSLVAP